MTDLGKADPSFLSEHVLSRLGATRDDVVLGPKPGVDFGMLELDGTALALATDPISVLPALGFERAGRFALHIVLSDVAVSGLDPSHLTISFALPDDVADDDFAALWSGVHEECLDLGVAVISGHTARYPGAEFPWVGAATALAVGDPGDVIRPDGARPGDRVLVTKGPAVETTGLFASLYPGVLADLGLDAETLAAAQELLDDVRVVEDARAAADAGTGGDGSPGEAGVTAMHDATEGGVVGAFCEMAMAAGVRFEVSMGDIPVLPAVYEATGAIGVDPWRCTTSGTLVLTVGPDAVDDVIEALEARGTPVGVAGEVVAGSGVDFDGEEFDEPPRDPSWDAYAALSGE